MDVGAVTESGGPHGPPAAPSAALTARLRRAEGQLRGVQRMLDEGAEHHDVLTQLAAVKAAVDQVGLQLMSERLRSCVSDGEAGCTAEFEQAMATLMRFGTMAR